MTSYAPFLMVSKIMPVRIPPEGGTTNLFSSLLEEKRRLTHPESSLVVRL
jgi:hypothetical protein